ncbi:MULTISPECIES: hypothetical protein [unclassified Aliiroseovarius]|uniref:hypothetical protein n=1 Tax=unclassified Aliiroseovarius TaxID=2623558 RepID=UPI001569E504|nr:MULTISPECIES: hypothetical protein [unclassified Aliiroseovarius]
MADIFELHDLLLEAGELPELFVVRGAINPEATPEDDGTVRRLKHPRPKEGINTPYFIETPRRWLNLDFDDIPNPDGLDPLSTEAMVYLRSLLPSEFQDITCSYSLSASAGLGETSNLNAHLWFMLDRPLGEAELKAWLGSYPVDKMLFGTVQPHFIANPKFEGGLVDPVEHRKGLLEGLGHVVKTPKISLTQVRTSYTSSNARFGPAKGYEERMAVLGDGPGGAGLHGVLTPAIASFISERGADFDREKLKGDIRRRVDDAFWDLSQHSEDYIAREISDDVLDRSIQDWIDKTALPIVPGYAETEKLHLEEARAATSQFVEAWVNRAVDWQESKETYDATIRGKTHFDLLSPEFIAPPRHALAAQVGLGKTHAYIEQLSRLVERTRPGHCVLITVPNHRLSAELRQRLSDAGIEAAVYLGPSQADPAHPGTTMCRRPDEFQVLQSAGASAALCKVCEFASSCGFQRQKSVKSQVWIAAHQVLFRARRAPITPADFVIVDEDPVQASFQEPANIDVSELPSDVQRAFANVPYNLPILRDEIALANGRLKHLASAVKRALPAIHLPHVANSGQISSALDMAREKTRGLLLASFYDSIRKGDPYGMRKVTGGDGHDAISWSRQRRLHRDFDVPILIADATLQTDVVRHLFDLPQSPVDYKAETFIDEDGSISHDYDYPMDPVVGSSRRISAETPATHNRQVLFSAAVSKLDDSRSGTRNIGRIRRYVEARSFDRDRVLVVCQKSLREKIEALGLPSNVECAHFNAIRGDDSWNDVDLLIVIGRTQPPPDAIERHAEALFGAQVKTLGPNYYDRVQAPLTGTTALVPFERHPDPHVELLRWGICEAELIQAIGRARAVNRRADEPLQVDIINTIPLPGIEIHEVMSWQDAQPAPAGVIAARHGLILCNPSSKGMSNAVATLLPDVFPGPNAARQANLFSQADLSKREHLLGISAREGGNGAQRGSLRKVRAPGSRYAVPAILLRPIERRGLVEGETYPTGADLTDEGIAVVGGLYVMKD